MARTIDALNREKGTQLRLRLTLPGQDEARRILGDYPCVCCDSLRDAAALARAVETSLVCYAPYAFDPKYAAMVTCSFPSKLMDYLCHGKFVLVHSPDYGSAARYFHEHALPAVITELSEAALKAALLAQLHSPQDHHALYQATLKKNHSYERFAATVGAALSR
jgi:hypothetical protein